MSNKKVVVVGIGYVGLPLALTLAKVGYTVTGVDINKKTIESINDGMMPIKEKDLETLFNEPIVRKNFKGSDEPNKADVFIICVQTPMDTISKQPDLSYVSSATESVAPFLEKGNLIIIESTVPPFTCRKVVKPLVEKATGLTVGKDIFLAHCPERIMPGETLKELVYNNRICGGINKESAIFAEEIYKSFVKGDIDVTDDVTAEMVKLMENTYRDVNIALANEFSLIGETLKVDVRDAIRFANKHPRVKILSPGIGVGGHCLPKDPWYLVYADPKNTTLIAMARKVNESMPERVAAKLRKMVRDVDNPKIIVLGMTYKPDSDDLRESPSLEIIRLLKEDGYNVTAYDNYVKGHEYTSILDLARGADCVTVLVEHTSIVKEVEANKKQILASMKTPIFFRVGQSDKPIS